MTDPRERRITARAFELWQTEGSLDGRSLSHWLQAEKEIDEALAEEARQKQVETPSMPRSRPPLR